jgi:hypothetical protein
MVSQGFRPFRAQITPEQIKAAMFQALGAKDNADFGIKWYGNGKDINGWAQDHGRYAWSDLFQQMARYDPVFANLSEYEKSNLANIAGQLEGNRALRAVGNEYGGQGATLGAPDYADFAAQGLSKAFGGGGNLNPMAGITDPNAFGTYLQGLQQQYADAVANNDQSRKHVLDSGALINSLRNTAGASIGGAFQENLQRFFDQAAGSPEGYGGFWSQFSNPFGQKVAIPTPTSPSTGGGTTGGGSTGGGTTDTPTNHHDETPEEAEKRRQIEEMMGHTGKGTTPIESGPQPGGPIDQPFGGPWDENHPDPHAGAATGQTGPSVDYTQNPHMDPNNGSHPGVDPDSGNPIDTTPFGTSRSESDIMAQKPAWMSAAEWRRMNGLS